MYSFLVLGGNVCYSPESVTALIKGEDHYQWFLYTSPKSVDVNFRGRDIQIVKGTKFGVRLSADKSKIRLIFSQDPTRVLTISQAQAQALAKGCKSLRNGVK